MAGDQVQRRGVFDGETVVTIGTIKEVYARKGHSRAMFRWLARIRWADGTRTEVRIQNLRADGDGWIQVAEGKLIWA